MKIDLQEGKFRCALGGAGSTLTAPPARCGSRGERAQRGARPGQSLKLRLGLAHHDQRRRDFLRTLGNNDETIPALLLPWRSHRRSAAAAPSSRTPSLQEADAWARSWLEETSAR